MTAFVSPVGPDSTVAQFISGGLFPDMGSAFVQNGLGDGVTLAQYITGGLDIAASGGGSAVIFRNRRGSRQPLFI